MKNSPNMPISSNRLRLNSSKTELIWLGSSRRLHHCSSTGMRVSDVDLRPVDCVRDLGVLIDSAWDDTGKARQPHFGCVLIPAPTTANHRRSLTSDAAHALVRALIHTRIDYCNGLLASCPRYLNDKLQVVLRVFAWPPGWYCNYVPIICVGGHVSAVALVGRGRPGEL